ncbi:Obp99a family protein [Megaselia abdita]
MKLLVVFFVAVALASTEYTVKTAEDTLAFKEECMKSLEIPEETAEKLGKSEYEDTPLVHKYLACVFEKFSFYTKEDGFDVSLLHKQVDPEVNHENHGEHNELHDNSKVR